jgi:hypothetical protein
MVSASEGGVGDDHGVVVIVVVVSVSVAWRS